MRLQSNSGNVVLTPNLIEFKRMYAGEVPTLNEELEFYKSTGDSSFGEVLTSHAVVEPISSLAKQFGNARICRKGLTDIVTDGLKAYYVKETGSLKRCGGIGDILAGTIGTFTQYG
jgi:ATP-dependent NAD(P)H-hydrate dehydratase